MLPLLTLANHCLLCANHYLPCANHYLPCANHYLLCASHYLPCASHYLLCANHYLLYANHYLLCASHYLLCANHYLLCASHYLLCASCKHCKDTSYKLLPIIYLILEPAVCSPFIEERCLLSTIVAAKTTRIIHADNIAKFISNSPNIDFIHAVSSLCTNTSSSTEARAFVQYISLSAG